MSNGYLVNFIRIIAQMNNYLEERPSVLYLTGLSIARNGPRQIDVPFKNGLNHNYLVLGLQLPDVNLS